MRLDSCSAGDPGGGLPQERGDDAQQEPDQGTDQDRVAAASRRRLRRPGRRDQLALFDVLRQSEELLVVREVADDLPLLLYREADLVGEQQALDGRKAVVVLHLRLE